MEQNPVEHLYYISVKDLTKEGMVRWKKTPAGDKQNFMFCILCQAKVKAVKVLAQAMKVAEKASKHKSASKDNAPKKKLKCTKVRCNHPQAALSGHISSTALYLY
jgi:hypothetical protein